MSVPYSSLGIIESRPITIRNPQRECPYTVGSFVYMALIHTVLISTLVLLFFWICLPLPSFLSAPLYRIFPHLPLRTRQTSSITRWCNDQKLRGLEAMNLRLELTLALKLESRVLLLFFMSSGLKCDDSSCEMACRAVRTHAFLTGYSDTNFLVLPIDTNLISPSHHTSIRPGGVLICRQHMVGALVVQKSSSGIESRQCMDPRNRRMNYGVSIVL